MMMKIKISALLLSFVFFLLIFLKTTLASCPVCIAATGAMVATARFYGVDDLITGTFVGGFVISGAAWIDRLLKKKKKNYIPLQLIGITILWLFIFITIFYIAGLIFSLFDRIVIGMLSGSIITLIAFRFHDFLKENNGNRSYIPFQVIFLSIVFLLLTVFGYYAIGVVQ